MNKLMYSAEEVNQILFEITLEKANLEECIKEIKDFCSISPSVVFPSDVMEIIEKYGR